MAERQMSIFVCVLAVAITFTHLPAAPPIARWSFDELPKAHVVGAAGLADGPRRPRHPDFSENNSALDLPLGSYLRITDDDNRFDFAHGDPITIEAWINPTSLDENAYILGKGRSRREGVKSKNQNWALRLRKRNEHACLNFLFHSVSTDDSSGTWHRWTSHRGFAVGSGWHHVAIQFRFGDSDSLIGWIDGKRMPGQWDMGGATSAAPVVDDDDLWIGSAMEADPSNSFVGMIDEIAIYRNELPKSFLSQRYRFAPRKIVVPQLPHDAVLFEFFGPHGAFDQFPETETPRITWMQPAMGIVQIPNCYDATGVRDDWTRPGYRTMLGRAWTEIELTPGDYQFLIRSRGLSRLVVDEKEIGSTKPQQHRQGAHHVVDPLPTVPFPEMRPHFMNDQEVLIDFHSDGGKHIVRFDFNIGSTRFCMRVGETCVAIAKRGQMFHLVSPRNSYPLTDEGWDTFVAKQSDLMTDFDAVRRRTAVEKQSDYWHRRHDHAREHLMVNDHRQSLDAQIQQRIQAHNDSIDIEAESSSHDVHFLNHVLPIFEAKCISCHGSKQAGGLKILDADNLKRGGDSGSPAVTPGQTMRSQLLERVTSGDESLRMPLDDHPLSRNEIDHLRKWIMSGGHVPAAPNQPVEMSEPVDDYTFLRRVFVDTVGVIPTLQEIERYFNDVTETRRANVIDRLLNDPRWADNWVGYWQDVLAENPNLLKPTLNNTGPFRYWIHDSLADNKSLDRFATELILMRGSPWYGGAAGFGIASQNDAPMAAKAHIIGNAFLGVELKCARCHDAPYHNWKQSDLFAVAAMLERSTVSLPETSTVPIDFFQQTSRKSLITASLAANSTIAPTWPFAEFNGAVNDRLLHEPEDSRERLAMHVTSSRRFSEVMANRLWKRLIGSGIVEPIHDWHHQEPSDPALLSLLADELIRVGYDQKRFIRWILNSEIYQRTAIEPSSYRFFAGPTRRRMTAEQIVDSALIAVGQPMRTEILSLDLEGTFKPDWFFNFGRPKRSWEFTTLANERDRPSLALPRAQAITDVLQAFGWRNSRPEPLSERQDTPNLIQPGSLANGTLGTWLTRLSDQSQITQMMRSETSVENLIERLFLRMLTRPPTTKEKEEFFAILSDGYASRVLAPPAIPIVIEKRRFRYVSWSNHLNTEANKIKTEMEIEARRGDPPTRLLSTSWRERAEDAIWALLNSPEMVIVP